MGEFDHNNFNQDDTRDNNVNNGPTPERKVPEYSFWAEQMSGNSYSYNNQKPVNSWEINNQMNDSPDPEKDHKEKKAGNKVLKFVVKAICFGLIAGACFLGVERIYFAVNPDAASNINLLGTGSSKEKNYEIGYTEPGAVQTQLRSTISDVIDKTIPSIVSIDSVSTQTNDWFGQQFDQEVQGSGSGIIVGKNENELLIATNNHVVAGTEKITVTFTDGKKADAIIKGTDATADLAVISVDITKMDKNTLDKITIAKLGNSDEVKVGEMAVAIGNALGYGQSVTVGYISAKDREVEVTDESNVNATKKMVLLQTDAAINPGNSGGALLNVKGEVIGINTIKYASSEVEGMGYAIPITRATPIINELMSREILKENEKGYLGITGNDVTEDVQAMLKLPLGVFVNTVSAGGAAEKAGLLPNDIITKVNDVEITAISQLRDYVNSLRAGTEVTVTYMRNINGAYTEKTTKVTLQQNPELTQSNQ